MKNVLIVTEINTIKGQNVFWILSGTKDLRFYNDVCFKKDTFL